MTENPVTSTVATTILSGKFESTSHFYNDAIHTFIHPTEGSRDLTKALLCKSLSLSSLFLTQGAALTM